MAEQYRSIWTPEGSPLAVGTARMARALGAALGDAARVSHAFCYGPPDIADCLRQALERGCRDLAVVPLFPQATGSTTGAIEDQVQAAVASLEDAGLPARERVRLAPVEPDCPHYVEALAARCREAFEAAGGEPEHLMISFHGLPVRYDESEGGGYSRACGRTADALLEVLGWDRERVSRTWQSRFGREEWLTPATDTTLEELPGRGVRSLAVVCPGFLTEGLETLEEIGMRGRESFEGAGGGPYTLVPAVEDHPAMVRSLERAVGR